MSIYEYKCQSCEKVSERYYPFAQAPQKDTCECGGEMIKVFGRTPVVFKGTGWAGKGRIT